MLTRPVRAFPGSIFLFRGSALQHIWPQLAIIVGVSVFITLEYEVWGLDVFTLTTIPFSLVGLALSIFLGFRNNACYDRWWEGRKLWGALINTTRTLARQILTLIGPRDESSLSEDDRAALAALREQSVRRVIAYAYGLKHHLRREATLDDLRPFLPMAEVQALHAQKNVPYALAQKLGEDFRDAWRRGWIDTYHLATLEQCLKDLTNIQGGCERIKNTPVPLSYTILTHRIVAVYCLALPFGIVAEVHAMTPLVVAIVSYAFLGLDSVGTQIEDPFEMDVNDLPLQALCRTIEVNLRQRLDDPELPPFHAPEGGVLF